MPPWHVTLLHNDVLSCCPLQMSAYSGACNGSCEMEMLGTCMTELSIASWAALPVPLWVHNGATLEWPKRIDSTMVASSELPSESLGFLAAACAHMHANK